MPRLSGLQGCGGSGHGRGGGDSTGILGLWLWAKGKYVWAGWEALDSAFLLPPLGILESWLHRNL